MVPDNVVTVQSQTQPMETGTLATSNRKAVLLGKVVTEPSQTQPMGTGTLANL